ncbi:MAG: 4Fe-4S ferredoxin iron-sulfur binding domain protein [Symbiobacteriaceae bacterium]|jgi:polyferredoxin|nr:4Fe-4S ferredoxin iron-sulfur binding domain protein [Symbiobacteriaceae bacterium]
MKRAAMTVPVAILLAFLALGTGMWLSTGQIMGLIFFGLIGTFAATGLGLYAALPKPKKPLGRRLALLLIGSLLIFTAFMGGENMQMEGFFFSLFGGIAQGALIHYLIAKVFGPLLFGRLWCGWACWTVMLLDLLPFQRSSGRLPARFGWLRYAHFALSAGIAAVLFYGVGFTGGATGRTALYWYLAGNAFYYATGIILAVTLKDNRAFCKYVCPITVPLKVGARLSILKVKGDAAACTDCGACAKACPMDIRVSDYHKQGLRVMSTECSLCQTCITSCNTGALKLSFGLDAAGPELLRERRKA